jgi:hypothetical protein
VERYINAFLCGSGFPAALNASHDVLRLIADDQDPTIIYKTTDPMYVASGRLLVGKDGMTERNKFPTVSMA